MAQNFYGSIVALITPFTAGGEIDWEALKRLINWHIAEGTHGIVPCGTTGESPTLSHQEHRDVVEFVVEHVDRRVPVIAGTGSNATEEAVELTRHAMQAKADAALVVTPYYNKPSQEGLFQHFQTIARAVPDLPIIIYNIPARSIVDMSNEVMARLARAPNIIGVKDATSDLTRVSAYHQSCGEDFCQLSGEDASTLGYMAMGGNGCISVSANVAPKLCAEFQTACRNGDWANAQALNARLMPLHQGLFLTSSPAPAKYVASLMGLCAAHVRLPLVEPSQQEQAQLKAIADQLGILC